MAPNTLETNVFLNRTNLLLAQNQRLVASWLPSSRKAEELRHEKSVEELEKEEQEIFNMPTPELFGIGAKPPKDGEVRREELSSNDKLRKHLLGRNHAKKQTDSINLMSRSGPEPLKVGSKPRPRSTKRDADDDSEDGGGRSSLGRSAKRSRTRPGPGAVDEAMVETEQLERDGSIATRQPLKKASNYLDEVLADRSLKKQKKRKKKKKKEQVIAEVLSNAS